MFKVFLDANVLFSSALTEGSGLLQLWQLTSVSLVVSDYTIIEAHRNLSVYAPERLEKLLDLVDSLAIVETITSTYLKEPILTEKDAYVLESAIGASCTHLLTGDLKHFGHPMGMTIQGVLVMKPGDFLKDYVS